MTDEQDTGAPNPDADPTTAADVPSEDVQLPDVEQAEQLPGVEEADGTGESIDPADHADKPWPGAEEGDERDSDEIDDPQPEEGRK